MNNNKNKTHTKKKTAKKKSAVRKYGESLVIAIGVAFIIRATVVYPFTIPTASMENTLLVGDFLLANKFVYGIRTPDWLGIPYTKVGFDIPFTRTPGFRKPQQGDVVIFKHPIKKSEHWIKRCIAVSGDTIEIRNKTTFVNGKVFSTPPHAKFIDKRTFPTTFMQHDIFPPGAGNTHNYGPVRVPAPGDTFCFNDTNRNRWFEWFQIIAYEGNKIAVDYDGWEVHLTTENRNEWNRHINTYPIESFAINRKSLDEYVYTIKDRHYFMMGDNRDNSLDSRHWGFLPERNIVGEALIIWWSWDKKVPLYRLFQKIRWTRLFVLIH